jgi:hypothetical protein
VNEGGEGLSATDDFLRCADEQIVQALEWVCRAAEADSRQSTAYEYREAYRTLRAALTAVRSLLSENE